MVIKRKSRHRRRRHHKSPRLYFGGYTDSWVAQPMDKSHKPDLIKRKKKELQDRYGYKWHDALLWGKFADKWYNKDKLEKGTIDSLTSRYQSGNDEQRARVLEELEDELKARDIATNPKVYMEELLKGKHKTHHTMAKLGGYGLQLAANFLAVKYGWPFARRWLFKQTGSAGAAGTGTTGTTAGTTGTSAAAGTGTTAGTGAAGVGSFGSNAGAPAGSDIKDIIKKGVEGAKSVAETIASKMRDYTPTEKTMLEGVNTTHTFTDLPFEIPKDLGTPELVKSFLKNNGGFNLSTELNPGFSGIKDGLAYVRDPEGKLYKLGIDQLPTWMNKYRELFPGFFSSWDTMVETIGKGDHLNWAQRTWRWLTGSGYHVTRKGRRLVRRYRRHLRHKRIKRLMRR